MPKPSLLAPFTKTLRALRERGVWGTVIQLYTVGDLKFGVLKGTDKFGNKYFEDLSEPYGQHRWVEYSNIHDYDATMIQPEWHGWMHHVFDETPEEARKLGFSAQATTPHSHAIYNTNVGQTNAVEEKEQVNTSQYRQRGFQVGSRMTGEKDKDSYYIQPGHPLSPLADKGGRFKERKHMQEWTPDLAQAKTK